ncbi:MAG: MoxR family ATPase [Dehalococcoidia bacterium]|nr:MoxR family ATPase [Dehalococcoidia bacterium]
MDVSIGEAQKVAIRIVDNVEKVIIGKRSAVELAVVALLARGHILVEDAPGVGKTIFARSIAKSIGCIFRRIQFTPDLLPGDITGVSIYNQKTNDFEFHPGPVVAQLVLADEINRATPKVQSALLECMEESQITVDGTVHRMPVPFVVMATQNPIEYEGTFPLPETQLDRFLLRLRLGYPTPEEEILIMERQQYFHPIEKLEQVVDAHDLLLLQEASRKVYIDERIKQYIVALVNSTRNHTAFRLGASPRGSLALFRTGQALALVKGRDYVLPDDIKTLAIPVLSHRVIVSSLNGREASGDSAIAALVETIPIPGALPFSKS